MRLAEMVAPKTYAAIKSVVQRDAVIMAIQRRVPDHRDWLACLVAIWVVKLPKSISTQVLAH